MCDTQGHADEVANACIVQLYERIKYLRTGEGPKLSSYEIRNIRVSWSKFTKGDTDAAGFKMFTKMFSMHPGTKKHFDFVHDTAAQQMQSSARLMFHVSRVAWYINLVVNNLEKLEEVVPMLHQVGGRHGAKGYNIPVTTLPLLGEAMNCLMTEEVPNFSPQDKKAWTELFGWIVKIMGQGMCQKKC